MSSRLFCFVLAAAALAAQELPDGPQSQHQPKKRIFWIYPVHDVTTADAPFRPLTPREKFQLFTESSFDRFTLISAGFDAGINQALDNPHGYGQGGEGYAKRYGAAIGDKVFSDFFRQYAYPSLFRQDPRYFALTARSGASTWRRIGYAMSRSLVTRGDSGRSQFNISEVMGVASSAALTNVWYPPEDRDVETTVARFGSRMGIGMAGNILKEFFPEITRMMRLPGGK